MVVLQRGFLLLCLACLGWATPALADDEMPMGNPGRPASEAALRPAAPPLARQPVTAPKAARQPAARQAAHFNRQQAMAEAEVYQEAPAELAPQRSAFVAQHPNPDEPLGFSESRFQPSAPIDPGYDIYEEYHQAEAQDAYMPDAPAITASSGKWLQSGYWYTEQSAVYMNRSVNLRNEIRLATDISSSILPQDRNILKIAPDMGYEPGLRSTIGRFIGRDIRNRDHSAEFTFLGLTHWHTAESITAQQAGAIFSDIDPTINVPAFNASNRQGYSLSSDMNSFEFNYRIQHRPFRDRMVYTRDSKWVRASTPTPITSLFAGIRVVSINETLGYSAESNTAIGTYDIITHNNMVGPQVGGDFFWEHYNWRAGVTGTAAAVVNWAEQSTRVRILNNAGAPLLPNRNEDVNDHTLGFAGGLTFLGAYRFRPHFSIRAAYDLMWVTNLALAQNQLNFFPSDPPQISTSHSLFFQGFSIGFEWNR